ncbi:MAG: response regulator [Desulfobacteraceae bacterium]|nr:MAG: response regulator [Desulfobacteraceae bacterium]
MVSRNTKVLVVDDDPFVREILGMVLGDNGFEIETAESGQEALGKFRADETIGLIISDMNMPEMSGLELIRNLRESGADVPFIILSGDSEMSAALPAIDSGADEYLLKDENIQDSITVAAARVLEKYRQRQVPH